VASLVSEIDGADPLFNGLAWLAGHVLDAPCAQVELVDDRASWWVGRFGVGGQRSAPVEGSFGQHVIAAGRPLLIGDARVHPLTRSNSWVETKGIIAWAGHPIRDASHQVLGTVCAFDTVARTWTDQDAEALAVLALAAEAELHRRSQLADWRRTESALATEVDIRRRHESRSMRIAELTRRLNFCSSTEAVASVIVELGPALFDSVFITVATVDVERRCLIEHHSAKAGDDMADQYLSVSMDALTPVGDALKTGKSVVVVDHHELAARYPHLLADAIELDVVTSVALPLQAPGCSIVGVLGIGWNEKTDPALPVWALMDTTAELCAQALERCRLADARRELVVSLQNELLPHVPPIEGLELCVYYAAARNELGFGGDWYDVVVIDADRTALIIGDVCGHGIPAAARMAEVRSTVGALVRLHPDQLDLVLFKSEAMLRHFDDPYIATFAVLLLDCMTATLTYVSAGHPPAVLIYPDGSWQALEDGRGPVLGLGARSSLRCGREELPVGAIVAAFTDGLVERRDRPLDVGIADLAAAIAAHPHRPVSEMADEAIAKLGRYPDDDSALVIARRT
jgi:GAF domain-containing protein